MAVILMLGFSLFVSAPVVAQEWNSGPERIHLIELYTSEGCSSCPPADRWLADLSDRKGLWSQFVPVGFHVDYWDQLGWKDPFARPEFTKRQRSYASAWESRSVYTPNFVVNGEEWKGWFSGKKWPRLENGKVGLLKVVSNTGEDFEIEFEPVERGEYSYSAVLLMLNRVSDVKRGENRGRQLEHGFVAAHLIEGKLEQEGEKFTTRFSFLERGVDPSRPWNAMAVWVRKTGEMAPIQAVGGPMSIP